MMIDNSGVLMSSVNNGSSLGRVLVGNRIEPCALFGSMYAMKLLI